MNLSQFIDVIITILLVVLTVVSAALFMVRRGWLPMPFSREQKAPIVAETDTESKARPHIFTRRAAGIIRVMSPYSAFVYNVLSIGLIFPWFYLWAPGALPGSNLVWGILLAGVVEIPIAFTYIWLSMTLPYSGGDYVFQSRILGGGIAFTVVMSGFVIWMLQWVALSGWLVSYLGFAPLLLGLGATLNNVNLSNLGIWFTQPQGIITASIGNAFLSLVLLVSGFKNYVRFQHIIWWGTLLAIGVVLSLLIFTPPATLMDRLNAFAAASGGPSNFYDTAVSAAKTAGVNLRPPFSLTATLLAAPIAWTSLQWATYSAQQSGEIKEVRNLKAQLFAMVGPLFLGVVVLALLAVGLERIVGSEFLYVAGAGYVAGASGANINGIHLWPSILAVSLAPHPIFVLIIGLGYILNGFQTMCSRYIGVSRVMFFMSFDRLLPEWFSRINERIHAPVNAHLAFFIAGIPVILGYNLVSSWEDLTLGVTFGCGYVFVFTSLAAALLPYRARDIYEASPVSQYKLGSVPMVTILGGLGAVLGAVMVLSFLIAPQLGVLGRWDFTDFPAHLWPQIFGLAIVAVPWCWYVLIKDFQKSKGIKVEYTVQEYPPE